MAKKGKKIPEEEIIYISKSELKREAQEMHDLAGKICKLNKKQREKLPLNEDLKEALVLADKLNTKTEAFRRHLNYVGKQLRLAENSEEIQKVLNAILDVGKESTVLFHKLERTRDQVIDQGDKKINELLADYDSLDRQKLRQLVRQAKKEQELGKPAKGYRELFQYLKEYILD